LLSIIPHSKRFLIIFLYQKAKYCFFCYNELIKR